MRRKRGRRLANGLPRGGLGHVGWVPTMGSLAVAWVLRPEYSAITGLLLIPLCVWFALGLRADDAAGEISDHFEINVPFSGEDTPSAMSDEPIRRWSTLMICISVFSCVGAMFRWWFGWWPFG